MRSYYTYNFHVVSPMTNKTFWVKTLYDSKNLIHKFVNDTKLQDCHFARLVPTFMIHQREHCNKLQ